MTFVDYNREYYYHDWEYAAFAKVFLLDISGFINSQCKYIQNYSQILNNFVKELRHLVP